MDDQLVDAFTFDNPMLLASAAVTFAIGFWEYIYSLRLTCAEGKSPFPIWMHTFYFAHDITFMVRCFFAAQCRDWNWFLLGTSGSMFVWVMFEGFHLYMAIAVERQEIWGIYTGKKVTVNGAIFSTLNQIIASCALVNILIVFMGEGFMFKWFFLTNLVMAAGPGELWRRRLSREGCSLGLAIVIVFGTIITFLPTGMFVLAMPEVFDTPWFYFTGIVFTAASISNLKVVSDLPPKNVSVTRPNPIW